MSASIENRSQNQESAAQITEDLEMRLSCTAVYETVLRALSRATIGKLGAFLVVSAFWASPILAVPIPVSSYVISTPPEPSFLDSTGTQLTDGILGDPNINQN